MVTQIADMLVTVSAGTKNGLFIHTLIPAPSYEVCPYPAWDPTSCWLGSSANWLTEDHVRDILCGTHDDEETETISTVSGYGGGGKSDEMIDHMLSAPMADDGSWILPGLPSRAGSPVREQTIFLAPSNVLNRDRCFADARDLARRARDAGQEIIVTMLRTGARTIEIGSRPTSGATITYATIRASLPDPSVDPLDVLGMLPPSFRADMERVLRDEQNYVSRQRLDANEQPTSLYGVVVNGWSTCPMGIPLMLANRWETNGFPNPDTVLRYIRLTSPAFDTGPDHVLTDRLQTFMDAWDAGSITRMDVAMRLGTLSALEGVPA